MANSDRGRRRDRDRGRKGGQERRQKQKKPPVQEHIPLERANLILFAIALVVIVAGYLVLATGSITLAPILLVLGYCVLVPVAIIYRPRRREGAASPPASGSVGE